MIAGVLLGLAIGIPVGLVTGVVCMGMALAVGRAIDESGDLDDSHNEACATVQDFAELCTCQGLGR